MARKRRRSYLPLYVVLAGWMKSGNPPSQLPRRLHPGAAEAREIIILEAKWEPKDKYLARWKFFGRINQDAEIVTMLHGKSNPVLPWRNDPPNGYPEEKELEGLYDMTQTRSCIN